MNRSNLYKPAPKQNSNRDHYENKIPDRPRLSKDLLSYKFPDETSPKNAFHSSQLPNQNRKNSPSSHEPASKKQSKYNPGSVFHQANKFNPYLSSSTNISSSVSESVEIIVSELDCPSEEETKYVCKPGDLSPLGELSESNSQDSGDASDTDAIRTILKKQKSLNSSIVQEPDKDKVIELLAESMTNIISIQQENEKNLACEKRNVRFQLLQLISDKEH
ncbi:unnamed protein product [Blepharisma stoltei]|uniref:Uncharacterized protein n=1 Tax=Blepharisma stoltei TaxID=1481888 RepID=A0AAU9IIQ9_9CILI|nr:unnamed protein product [Blepharisma stoltei]